MDNNVQILKNVIQKLGIKLANLEIVNSEIISKYEMLVKENEQLMKQIESLAASNVEEGNK